MKPYFIVGEVFIFALIIVLFLITHATDESEKNTHTFVTVEDGVVEVTNVKNPKEVKNLKKGETVSAAMGKWQITLTGDRSETAPLAPIGSVSGTLVDSNTSTLNLITGGTVQPASGEAYWISGYVSKADAGYFPGVDISVVKDEETQTITTKTNENGYYSVRVKTEGKYQINVTPSDEYLTASASIVLSASEPNGVKHFVLTKAGLIVQGKVIDKKTEKPIGGAEVSLMPMKDANPDQQIEKGITDEDGLFTIKRLAPGIFALTAKAKRYITYDPSNFYQNPDPLSHIRIDETSPKKDILVKMEPGFAAKVIVKNPQGQPESDALIYVILSGLDSLYTNQTVKTDADGESIIDTLPQTNAAVLVRKPPFGETLSRVFAAGTQENPTLVEVTLTNAAKVSGKVTDKNGNPLKQRQLSAAYTRIQERLPGSSWGYFEENLTDDNGRYHFDCLGTGSYKIQVLSSENSDYRFQASASRDLQLKAGDQLENIDFIVEEEEGTEEINGRVVNRNGRPIAEANVTLWILQPSIPPNQQQYIKDTQSDDQGEFHFKKVISADQYRLVVSGKDYKSYNQQFSMSEKDITVVLEANGTVRGTAIAKDTQHPVSDAQIVLTGNGILYETTKEDGSFYFDSVEPGTYQISGQGQGYAVTEGPKVEVKSAQSTEGIILQLETGLELEGIIVDINQQPLANAVVALKSKTPISQRLISQARFPGNSVMTDGNGHFRIRGISPNDDSLLQIKHPDFAEQQVPILLEAIGKEPLVITMTIGGTLIGVVYDADQKPISEVPVIASNYPMNQYVYQTVTNEMGEYRLDHLPAISFTVLINRRKEPSRPALSSETKSVQIEEGKTVRLDFGVGEGAVISGTVFKAGNPVPGAQVILGGFSSPQHMDTTSQVDGTYILRGIAPGEYRIWFRFPGVGNERSFLMEGLKKVVITPEPKEYRIDLNGQSAKIVGTVKEADTGNPAADVQIQPIMSFQDPINPNMFMGQGVSNAEGVFTLELHGSGTFSLVAVKEGYTRQEFNVTVPENPPGVESPPISIEVLITKADTALEVYLTYNHQPFTSPSIHFVALRGNTIQEFAFKTQPDQPGVYYLSGMNEGPLELMVTGQSNNLSLTAFLGPIQIHKGLTGKLLGSMMEMVGYQLVLNPPKGETLRGKIQIEVPEFPQIARISSQMANNIYVLPLPKGKIPIRLKVSGYKPIECIPEDLSQPGDRPTFRLVPLNLVKE